MASDRVRIASDAYEAWNRGDFDAVVENAAPEIEWKTRGVVELHFNGKGRESGVAVELNWAQVITYRGHLILRIAGYPTVGDAREREGLEAAV